MISFLDAGIETPRTPEGLILIDVVLTAFKDLDHGSPRDKETARAFFFDSDPRCENHPRADRYCELLGFDPEVVRLAAEKIRGGRLSLPEVQERSSEERKERERKAASKRARIWGINRSNRGAK